MSPNAISLLQFVVPVLAAGAALRCWRFGWRTASDPHQIGGAVTFAAAVVVGGLIASRVVLP